MSSTERASTLKSTELIPKKKRSKYSRNGCLKCKRMKVKCDEFKPTCGRCQRTSKACSYVTGPAKLDRRSKSGTPTSPTNLMDSIDHNMSLKIDEILSIDNDLDDFNISLSPYYDSELYSQIDSNYLNLLQCYGDSNKKVLNRDELLSPDSVWSIPRILFTVFKKPSHEHYFDIFYDQFSHIVMPIKPDPNSNPVRDILLSYAFRKDYLYYAILASGARLSYQATLLGDDQQHYSVFMQRTSHMLDDFTFLQNYKPDARSLDVVYQKLEPLLLTILLLTSDNAASMEQSWRGHLRGAKELLQKVFVEKLFPETKILVFCKCWFTSFEILAGLGAPYGGTLVEEKEIESLVISIDSQYEVAILKSLKIVDEDNYNFLFGFHNNLLPPLLKLISLIRLNLKDDGKLKGKQIFALISEFEALSNSSAPAYWKLVSHCCYSDAALLTILTKFLKVPSSINAVQELVHGVLNKLDYILSSDTARPYELLLPHWPILVAGLNCVSEEDKYKIEKLFRLLDSLGSGSAKHAFEKIKKTWNHESSDDEVDIVTY